MIRTKDMPLVIGQTLPITFTVRDQLNNRISLTGATAYLSILADVKVPPVVKLASSVTAGYRVGIVLADQTADHKGEYTATIIPTDTQGFVPLGAEDPYLYDSWVVLADGSRWPAIALSKMPCYRTATTLA